MATAEWRTHQGKQYLYIDHGGTEQETLANLDRALDLLRGAGSHEVLILANVERAYGTAAVMEGLGRFARETKPYVRRRAVVGLRGIQKFLLQTFNAMAGQAAVPRSTEAEALEYLIEA